jgi:hypothetical protein
VSQESLIQNPMNIQQANLKVSEKKFGRQKRRRAQAAAAFFKIFSAA